MDKQNDNEQIDMLLDQLTHLYDTLNDIAIQEKIIQTGLQSEKLKKSKNFVESMIKKKKEKIQRLRQNNSSSNQT